MAEALLFLSAIQATTQLVEQSFGVIRRIRTAHIQDKHLGTVLTRHKQELESIKSILGVIEDIEDLRTPQVAEELYRLRDTQDKLTSLLKALDPGAKSKASRLLHQLTEGSSDEKKLSAVMSELRDVKGSLMLRIQAVNIGVTKENGRTLVANSILIEQINGTLLDHVKDCEGLRIARLLEGRATSDDGLVPLTRADMKAISGQGYESDSEDSSEETLVDESELPARDISVKTERLILQNATKDQAFQINGPIGEDIWIKINRLVIKDNIAEGQSIQVNYPMTMEAFKLYMKVQAGNIERNDRPTGRKRHDSMDP